MASYRRQIRSNLIVCDAAEATPKLIHSLLDLIVYLNNKGIRLCFLRDPDHQPPPSPALVPFHETTETVDNWVNQYTPIKDIIALPDLLRQHSFILLVKATDAEITHIVNSVNSQSIPHDYGYGEK
ncbi:hypothetical protein BFJ63_vAg11565 [Fusarium oxysporum f. sp. narcissi]|uniref:Uncharacterized protein n=1 Tax=Fusarium oxysporum f. sp. narcissi TaxID=451672 RepID=A0A4Q2VD63_FUSOX|nr:hypothetical protein BFJ63_vAg11565 [Fusarium oxysporum f. sp. narcissi]